MLNKETLWTGCAPADSSSVSPSKSTLQSALAKSLANTFFASQSFAKLVETFLRRIPSLPFCQSCLLPAVPFLAILSLLIGSFLPTSALAQSTIGTMTPSLTGGNNAADNSLFKQYYQANPDPQLQRAKSFWEPAGTYRPDESIKQPKVNRFYRSKGASPEIYTEPNLTYGSNHSLVKPRIKPTLKELGFASPNIRPILEKGALLENEARWNEALQLYQKSLKKNPSDPHLLDHRQLARIHVDIASRMADKTYVQIVKNDSPQYAMAALEEILSNIHAYHFAEPDWNKMIHHGVRNLTEVMKDKKFIRAFAPDGYERTFQGAIKQLEAHKKGIQIRSRHDYLRLVETISKFVESKCGLSQSVTISEFCCSSISSLDTYSGYMSPETFKDFNSRLHGQFVGIGVEIHITKKSLEVVKVFPGGPADDARIRAEDKILAVNGYKVQKVGGNKAADLLRGTEGSELTVLVQTPEKKEYLLRMKRRHIEVSSISKAEIIDQKNGVGYIQLNSFQKNSLGEFDNAMIHLHRQGMKSLVLDLRDNPGGVLEVCIKIANRLLPSGRIVTTRGRNKGDNTDPHAHSPRQTWNIPLVVLIDENSASASEILAAAIGDNARGHVIGTRSYGKGSVQGIFSLASGRGGLRLTTAKFFSPKGRAISLQGVLPTKEINITAKVNADGTKKKVIFGSKDDQVLGAGVSLLTRRAPVSAN